VRVISIPAAAIKSGEVLENTNVIPFPGASPDAAIHAAVAARLQAAAGEHVPHSELLWIAAHAWKEWRLSRPWPDEAAYVADLKDHTALMRRAMETQAAEQIARGEDPLYKADDYYHRSAEEEAPKKEKRKKPKLDPAPGAPEPKAEDFADVLGRIPRLFTYRHADGTPHSVVARWDFGPGDKKVLHYYWGGCDRVAAHWIEQHHPSPILYRLPEVLAGLRQGRTVVVVEGEKDTLGAIERWGFENDRIYVVTTTPGGGRHSSNSAAWDNVDLFPLSGADVILVPDLDGPGRAWCRGIGNILMAMNGKPAAVRVGIIPKAWGNGYGKGWGFGDKLPGNASEAGVERIITEAVPFRAWEISEEQARGGPGTQGTQAGDPWGDAEPIVEVREREPYPILALPGGIREAIQEAIGFLQCPPELAAGSALSVLSLAGQGIANIARSKKRLVSPVSLYHLATLDSGERKSAADKMFSEIIEQFQHEEREHRAIEIRRYHSAMEGWRARCTGINRAISAAAKAGKPTEALQKSLDDMTEPVKPRIPQWLYENTTTEGLAWALHTGWPTGAILSPEAAVVLGGYGMRSDSVKNNLTLLNKLWDGASQPITGRADDASYILRGARLTMGLAAQLAVVRQFLEGTDGIARGMGFLSRCLMSWPRSMAGYQPFKEEEDLDHVDAFNRKILRLLKDAPQPDPKTGQLALETLHFSPEGKKTWVEFFNRVDKGKRPDGPYFEIKDIAAKAGDNAARLAALFHLYEHHGTDNKLIGADTAGRACLIVGWHLEEARHFLSTAAAPAECREIVALDAWLIKHCISNGVAKVPAGDVGRIGPPATRPAKKRNQALTELAEMNRSRLVKVGKQRWIEVNPKLLG